jgi:hypothetical protein
MVRFENWALVVRKGWTIIHWAGLSITEFLGDATTPIGIAAGPVRNSVMLEDFKPDRLLCYPGNVGTTDCARKARKLGIERDFCTPVRDIFEQAGEWG